MQGKVIGINTAISAGANGIGFSIPLSNRVVEAMIKSVVRYAQIKRSFIGVRYGMLSPALAQSMKLPFTEGALIGGGALNADTPSVVPNSPGAQAGLESGDIIVEADGRAITRTFGLREALGEKLP